jgi:hypothetical protein
MMFMHGVTILFNKEKEIRNGNLGMWRCTIIYDTKLTSTKINKESHKAQKKEELT